MDRRSPPAVAHRGVSLVTPGIVIPDIVIGRAGLDPLDQPRRPGLGKLARLDVVGAGNGIGWRDGSGARSPGVAGMEGSWRRAAIRTNIE
ncbi:MAG: hypothetical protein ACRYGP_07080 [Janthinobacterium lividum]